MKIKEKKIDIRNNRNFRNNQNYIIGDLDKKYMIYRFFDKKKKFIDNDIIIRFIIPILILIIIFIFLYFNINMQYLILISISLMVLFGIWFSFYMLMMLVDYGYIMKLIKKISYKFSRKPKGILLKNNPNGKYKEISHYFVVDDNKNALNESWKVIAKDFTYIYK